MGSHTPSSLHILHGSSGTFGGLLLLLRLLLSWLTWPLAVAAATAHRRRTTAQLATSALEPGRQRPEKRARLVQEPAIGEEQGTASTREVWSGGCAKANASSPGPRYCP